MIKANLGTINMEGSIVELEADMVSLLVLFEEKAAEHYGCTEDEMFEKLIQSRSAMKMLKSGMDANEVAKILTGEGIPEERARETKANLKELYIERGVGLPDSMK